MFVIISAHVTSDGRLNLGWQREIEEQSTEQTERNDYGQFIWAEVAVTRARADFTHSQAELM